MSSAFLRAVKAHVHIECDDGTTYEMDLIEDLPMDLEVSLTVDTEPVDATYDDPDPGNWLPYRTYKPGPRTGSVTLRGRLMDARFTRPSETPATPLGSGATDNAHSGLSDDLSGPQ